MLSTFPSFTEFLLVFYNIRAYVFNELTHCDLVLNQKCLAGVHFSFIFIEEKGP